MPSRSQISSVRFDQQIARLPTLTVWSSSSTTTSWPCRARSSAATSPTGPAPITTTGWRTGAAARSSGDGS
jgi:hypothetical protein